MNVNIIFFRQENIKVINFLVNNKNNIYPCSFIIVYAQLACADSN